MKEKLDNILLALLWLVISALGACFWFNSQYGFNIFSDSHWRHLAYMQAAQTPVQPSFYISMVITVFLIIFVLYLLLRPRIRHISIPTRHIVHKNYMTQPIATPRANDTNSGPALTGPATTPAKSSPEPVPSTTTIATPSRPPRLNIALSPILHTPQKKTEPSTGTDTQPDWSQIHDIFQSAGYTIKPAPKIGGLRPALMAIGTNESLWIGAVGVRISELQNAIDIINQIFLDTLDDIIINISGFIVASPDTVNSDGMPILLFDSISSLGEYMHKHENPPIAPDDDGNFDAFSSYISTVIEYIGKM